MQGQIHKTQAALIPLVCNTRVVLEFFPFLVLLGNPFSALVYEVVQSQLWFVELWKEAVKHFAVFWVSVAATPWSKNGSNTV